MGGLLSKPKTPKPAPPPEPLPPPPERSSAQIESAAEIQRKKFRGSSGRAATFLTGGLGVDSGYAAAKFLGG